ncbi:hypothetical protein FHR71_000733 [Methylobacterium sp. RAS18]|nr:hypothetical protein [Methylobacterium sp. RAS18]
MHPIKDLPKPGLYTRAQALALSRGETPPDPAEEKRKSKVERKLRRKPVAKWPPFAPLWDHEPGNFHRSADGCSAAKFREAYSNGLMLAEVDLIELDAALIGNSRRTVQEVWGVGADDKVARAIRYWSEGGAMTPAMVQPHTTGEIIIVGGNNRLAVARAKGVSRVPVLFEPEHLPAMQANLPNLVVLSTHSA